MPPTRVVIATDKFKGSLTAHEAAMRIRAGLQRAVADLDVVIVPVADGGDGTVDAAVAAGFDGIPVIASGPTGMPVGTRYARRGDDAVVELASACGLVRLPHGVLDPLGASSFGVGEVIRDALDAGCRHIVLGVGGSASTDGGAGMLAALGARMDSPNFPSVSTLDLSGLHPALAKTDFVVACDVDNPLYGARGAAHVYGPQKGADPAQVELLDAALRRWADIVHDATGHSAVESDAASLPGAGAAGGVAYAAHAVFGARLQSGIELVLDFVGFADRLPGTRLVITGEGSLDEQTLAGKAPAGVAAAARAAGVTTVAVAGRTTLSVERLVAAGIAAAYPLTDLEGDPVRCMVDAGPLLERVAEKVARDWL